MAKGPKKHGDVVLESTTVDSHFALAADPAFASLVAPLGTLPGGPFDYAYVSTSASGPGSVLKVGASLSALDGVISSGNGKDTVDLSLSTGANLVLAGNGNDTVIGGLGADNVVGGNGTDVLGGGAGNDVVNGGTGKDTITGGLDTGTFSSTTDVGTGVTTTAFVAGDILTGGKGNDTFHYAAGDGVDEITDFEVGKDSITFHGITAEQLVTFSDGTDSYIGINDGTGAMAANSVIRLDGVTDVNQVLSHHGLLFA
jgi:Ca2+-binding RTX toxin-like protein